MEITHGLISINKFKVVIMLRHMVIEKNFTPVKWLQSACDKAQATTNAWLLCNNSIVYYVGATLYYLSLVHDKAVCVVFSSMVTEGGNVSNTTERGTRYCTRQWTVM